MLNFVKWSVYKAIQTYPMSLWSHFWKLSSCDWYGDDLYHKHVTKKYVCVGDAST